MLILVIPSLSRSTNIGLPTITIFFQPVDKQIEKQIWLATAAHSGDDFNHAVVPAFYNPIQIDITLYLHNAVLFPKKCDMPHIFGIQRYLIIFIRTNIQLINLIILKVYFLHKESTKPIKTNSITNYLGHYWKKTQKTPKKEIEKAEAIRQEYFNDKNICDDITVE